MRLLRICDGKQSRELTGIIGWKVASASIYLMYYSDAFTSLLEATSKLPVGGPSVLFKGLPLWYCGTHLPLMGLYGHTAGFFP